MNESKQDLYKFGYKIIYYLLFILERFTYQIYKLFYRINNKIENIKIDIHLKILTGDF